MRRSVAVLTALATCLAASARADELRPMAALSIKLGDVIGTAYYTVETDGYQVVATVASSTDAIPVRFVATLTSGQKVQVSVPRGVGEAALALEMRRVEDRVFVTPAMW
jgi:hypothetical protein